MEEAITHEDRINRLKHEREKAMRHVDTYPQAAWMVIVELNLLIMKLEMQCAGVD